MKSSFTHTLLTALVLGILSSSIGLVAQDAKGVAKVIVLRGTATAEMKPFGAVPLKKGTWLPEGTIIKTTPKAFVKLLFVDKSTMNVGPKSEIVISKFPKESAGVINLIQGQIRSKVTKNYMNMKDKDKSKLFIKTSTAALGVRGTDYIVTHSQVTNRTGLDVVRGAVAFAKIDENLAGSLSQSALEAAVSSKEAVLVEKGYRSQVLPNQNKAAPPVKIPRTELDGLESNEHLLSDSSQIVGNDDQGDDTVGVEKNATEKKRVSMVVPPGLDPELAVNRNVEMEGQAVEMAMIENQDSSTTEGDPALSDGGRAPASIGLPESYNPNSGDQVFAVENSNDVYENQGFDSGPVQCFDPCACYNICTVGTGGVTDGGEIIDEFQDFNDQVNTRSVVRFIITTSD